MQSQKNETNKRENIKENGKYQPFTYLPRKSFKQASRNLQMRADS